MLENARLLRPLNFLRIKGHSSLPYYKLWYPAIFAGILTIYIFLYPNKVNFWGKDFIGSSIIIFSQVMIGFYVASLAAIATFSRECLDKPIDGEKLTLFSKENGILYNRILTRRHFLTYLFGYLSFLSIFIYIFGIFFSTISPIIFIEKYTKIPIEWVSIFFVFTYLYLFFQMIILTLFGLFYLSDRLQWYSEKS